MQAQAPTDIRSAFPAIALLPGKLWIFSLALLLQPQYWLWLVEHDIGGHNFGYRDDELECRWYQLGVFSPIMRLHSTKNEFNGKEPWQYRRDICEIMENFLRLRHKLIPYLYTMNHRAFAEDLPLILPLHYEHGWRNAFGKVKNEYYYGTEMLVNPITAPMAENLNMGKASTWLRRGPLLTFSQEWFISRRNELFDMYRPLDSIPVLVKAGGIVPMTEEIDSKEAAANPEKLYLRIFSGADGSFTLYEDDNETIAYQNGECALTEYTLNWEKEKKFTISAVRGRKELILRNVPIPLSGMLWSFRKMQQCRYLLMVFLVIFRIAIWQRKENSLLSFRPSQQKTRSRSACRRRPACTEIRPSAIFLKF